MSEFHILRPWWLLALVPSLWIVCALWREQGAVSSWERVFDQQLLEHLWLEPPGAHSRLPIMLLAFGWMLAVLALAGPTWERQPEPVWRSQASRVIVLDLSASMNAADLMPSRLERARFKILDILAATGDARTGLVVFAGEPHVVVPLTEDADTIMNLLRALSTDIVPAAGDEAAPALELASELLENAGVARGELVLISDGVSDPAAALAVAKGLRNRGSRLSVLGVGTAQGAPVPRADGGFAGMARLIAAPLEALARAGGGAYSPITASDRDLETVLLDGPRSAPAHELSGAGVQRWTEPGVWLVPLLLLLAAAGFRRGWLAGLVMIMVVPPPAQALQWRDLWLRPDQQAAAALERGQPATAARQFADPSWRGMALYRAGDYAGAAEAFAQSGGAESDYNRGNALARAGRLEEAADAYRQVLREVPEHADAKANLALVEDLLRKNREQSDQAEGSSDERGAPPSESEEVNGGESRTDARGQSSSGDKPGTDSSEFPDGEAGDDRNRAEQSARQSQDESEPVDPSDEIGDRATEAAGEAADSMASAQRDVADSAHSQMGTDTDTTPLNQPPGSHSERPSERAIALDQWLRQIPDDPAGLLRRKFMLEHLQRQQER